MPRECNSSRQLLPRIPPPVRVHAKWMILPNPVSGSVIPWKKTVPNPPRPRPGRFCTELEEQDTTRRFLWRMRPLRFFRLTERSGFLHGHPGSSPSSFNIASPFVNHEKPKAKRAKVSNQYTGLYPPRREATSSGRK